jgi:glycosyltransferase involved in cell wall biosynthesis
LAQGIAAVLADPGLQAALVDGGARRVETEFGRGPIMDQYLELYRRVASSE